jgi:molybdate transport system regulatory protein
MLELTGMLWLKAGDRKWGGHERIELLAQIGETGSITQAARAVGMSYKGAWDAIDAMNNLSDEPLVKRSAGGKSGGGTELTPRAHRLIDAFRALEAEHQRFLASLNSFSGASVQDIELMRKFMIKTSARNQLAGTVVNVQNGAVNDAIELEIQGGQRIVATITTESTQALGLVAGSPAMALIKASSVLLGLPDPGMRLSARNQLTGTVSRVARGAVNAEVTVDLARGGVVVAVVTNGSADSLALAEGVPVIAIIKASSIILGTTG